MKKQSEGKIKVETEIKKTLEEILSQLSVVGNVTVKQGEEARHYEVTIESDESGLLIGHHGETINSLQLLLGIILYKKSQEWLRLILDVGGYRQAREESIKEMVRRIVTEVETQKQPVSLPYLTPFERRTVHLMLADSQTVVSASEGEGKERRITIKPK